MHRQPGWMVWIWWMTAAAPVAAQAWDAPAARDLRDRAALRRTEEAGAAALGWRGSATGIIRWFVQTGPDALAATARPVTTDLVRVQVYGRGGAGSKQVIEQWTRERSLPADITYHRDHLGIVTSGFGDAIRLGDGDEVRDVPHPLSQGAELHYEVALGELLVVRAPEGELRVRQLLVRPRVPTESAVLGILDIDSESGALVRFSFGFTAAAYRDPTVEGITVTLEQARAEQGIWLPYRQSIEIRRRAASVDLPIRTVIRADWRIDALLDTATVLPFTGDASIGGLRRPVVGKVSAPSTPLVDDATLRRRIELSVDRRMQDARQALRFGAAGGSRLVAFDRVQGPSLGGGAAMQAGAVRFSGQVGVGLAEGRPAGSLAVSAPLGDGRWEVAGGREVQDVSDRPVISPALNSLRTLVASDDAGDWAAVSRVSLGWRRPAQSRRLGLAVSLAIEDADSLAARAATLSGRLRANPSLGSGTYGVVRAAVQSGTVQVQGEAGTGPNSYGRLAAQLGVERPLGDGLLQLSLNAGIASRGAPDRRGFVLGGRQSLVGERYRAYDGFGVVAARVAWLTDLPVPELRLRGPLTTGPRLRIGPFAGAGGTWRDVPALAGTGSSGWRPVVGFAAEPFWRLLRVEAGIPLRGPDAGRPRVVLDVHPDWWPLL